MGGYGGSGALGGLLQGIAAGRQARMQLMRAADEHQQIQQLMRQRDQQIAADQQGNALRMLSDRMNLEMSGARPVSNGMVEDMLSSPDQAAAPADATASGSAPAATAAPERDFTPSNFTPAPANTGSLDALRAATGVQGEAAPAQAPGGRFMRKADRSRTVEVPWVDGSKLQYELPTREEQIARQAQMTLAQQMREKLGMAQTDQYVLHAFGVPVPDAIANTLGLPQGMKVMRNELPGLADKAAQVRNAGWKEVTPGGMLVNTNPGGTRTGGGAPAGAPATGQPGGSPAAPATAPGVALRNPPLEDPTTRMARNYTAEILGKRPEDVTYQELAKGKADWELLSMNPLDRKVKEGELQLQPLTAAEKRSTMAMQAVQTQVRKQELDLAGDDDTINMAAQKYLQTGQMPSLGMGSVLLRGRIMGRAAEQAKAAGLSPEQIPALQDTYKALSKSLSDLQTRQGQILAFEKGGGANLDNFIRLAQKQVDAGSPLINRSLRGAARTIAGDKDQAAADAARVAAFNEISKILSGSLGNGAVSDSARGEAEKLLSGDYTMGQLLNVAKVLRTDMQNRSSAYGQQINEVRTQMQNLTKPAGAANGASNGQISVPDPQGGVHTFADQASADRFKALAGIK